MQVDAVERRLGRTDLVQVGEVVVDEMREMAPMGTCPIMAALVQLGSVSAHPAMVQ